MCLPFYTNITRSKCERKNNCYGFGMANVFRKILRNTCTKSYSSKLSFKFYSKDAKEKSRFKFLSYVITKYVNLVKTYEKAFPKAAKLYYTFSTGIKSFKDDGVLLFQAFKKVNTDGICSLTRRELEIYYEMPKNMIKVAPIIVIGTMVPFGAAVFALGTMYPKKTLSHHFWSEAQKNEFALMDHKKRLQLYKPILSHIQTHLKHIKDLDTCNQMSMVLDCLEKRINPSVEDILLCKPIFEKYPFNLKYLESSHLKLLLQLHYLHQGWRRKIRLENFGAFIQMMDRAISKEGGVEKLNQDDLRWALFFRGLNPINMEHDDIVTWLKNWLLISNDLNSNSFSLLLHCPVLLAFSQPTNLELMKA